MLVLKKVYRDLVARDLAYHVIGLNTQCLWVTPNPIPGLHLKILGT